ncbi:MAG: baseplate J/gp47 family protein [Anaerolineales bacterium]
MKTHIIHLDEQDDVVSARDKMTWGRAARLLLVYPRRGRILWRTFDLRLLQRQAASQGASLALVTRSAEVRRAAASLGIPVFRSEAEAQRYHWPQPRRGPRFKRLGPRPDFRLWRASLEWPAAPWRNHPAVRLGVFAAAVLAILFLLILLVPSAEIRLQVETRTQSLTLPLRASPQAETVNLAGVVPSRQAVTVVGGMQTVAINSLSDVPDEFATGEVVFRNLTDEQMGIPAGTIVCTLDEPVWRFVTTADAVVAGEVDATVSVPVRALVAGAAGNLPAGSLAAIESDLGASLAVTNPAPMTGGTDRLAVVPSAEDRAALRQALLADLSQRALEQFEQELSPGDLLFMDTFTVSRILSETYLPAAGQPGNRLTLTLQVEFQVRYAAGEDLARLATVSLDAGLPEGYEPVPGSLRLLAVGEPVTAPEGETLWQMRAEREIRQRVDPAAAAYLVRGRTRRSAARHLAEAFPLLAPPEFRLKPAFWPLLPTLPFRISVEY